MLQSLRLTIVLLLVFLGLCSAQHNTTVNNTSPSITYEGNAGDAAICKYNPDGTLVSGQGGCWNAPSMCTEGVSMGQGGTGAASFSFNGSAIYINSLLNYFSPIYTVTLDGKSTEVDGVRPSGVFICAPLFSQTGLDPEVEHTIRLSVKGASPTRNTTRPNSENSFAFSVISFVYTEGPVGNTTKTSSAGVNSTTTSGGNSAQTSAPSSAEAPQLSARLVLAIVLAMGWSVLS